MRVRAGVCGRHVRDSPFRSWHWGAEAGGSRLVRDVRRRRVCRVRRPARASPCLPSSADAGSVACTDGRVADGLVRVRGHRVCPSRVPLPKEGRRRVRADDGGLVVPVCADMAVRCRPASCFRQTCPARSRRRNLQDGSRERRRNRREGASGSHGSASSYGDDNAELRPDSDCQEAAGKGSGNSAVRPCRFSERIQPPAFP